MNGQQADGIYDLQGRRISSKLNDGTPTGINVVKMNGQQADGIYDLQGRRISSNKGKGIYIINGKKVILK